MLDTNILSVPITKEPIPEVAARIRREWAHIVVAAPVLHEIQFGAERLPAGSEAQEIMLAFVDRILTRRIVGYDRSAAVWHAKERARMQRAGVTRPVFDSQIAAIAAVNDLTVVTRSVDDFAGFDGLRVARW